MKIKHINASVMFLSLVVLSGCFPAEIKGKTPSGEMIEVLFYTGGNNLDDLIIYNSVNYFGKAQYQLDDPMADVGFRIKTGERVQAECSVEGVDIIGAPECKEYKVYRSSVPFFPVDTIIYRPELF